MSLKVLLISPFHGSSSHAAWAEGLKKHSSHQIDIVELDDRAWSWRLRGGALPLRDKLLRYDEPVDVVLATSLTCLSSLYGLLRRSPLAGLPTVYYMHENQLTYPIRPGGRRDPGLVLRQFHSQLAADFVWFNSEHNMKSWFKKLPVFLKKFKDHQGFDHVEQLKARSQVVPLGLSLRAAKPAPDSTRPLLLWNQRWAWEKGVDRFLGLIQKFDKEAPFDVVLLGRPVPDREREELEEFLGPRLLHAGWCSKEEYWKWLARSSVTVSVARHEFFGISLLEAAACGVMTFLPKRLSYPEIIPSELHSSCFYSSAKDLYRRVKRFLEKPQEFRETRESLRQAALGFDWRNRAGSYDEELERVMLACAGAL